MHVGEAVLESQLSHFQELHDELEATMLKWIEICGTPLNQPASAPFFNKNNYEAFLHFQDWLIL